MRHPRIAAAVLIAPLAVVVTYVVARSSPAQASSPASPPGHRFTLFSGSLESKRGPGVEAAVAPRILKIDGLTGRTWCLRTVEGRGGKADETWVEIDEQ